MKFFLGMDVGTVSAKWALIGPRDRIEALKAKANSPVAEVYPFPDEPDKAIGVSEYRRIQGRPLEEAVVLGAAAGAANFLHAGMGTGDRASIERLAERVRIEAYPAPNGG